MGWLTSTQREKAEKAAKKKNEEEARRHLQDYHRDVHNLNELFISQNFRLDSLNKHLDLIDKALTAAGKAHGGSGTWEDAQHAMDAIKKNIKAVEDEATKKGMSLADGGRIRDVLK